MKHIVLVSPTLGGGGAERTVIMLANALSSDSDLRVSLIVATTKGAAGQLKSELLANVQLVDFDCDRVWGLLSCLPAWLKNIRPDVVICTQTHANIICYFAIKRSGHSCRFIVREVSTPSVNLKHNKGIKKWLIQSLMRYVYHRANHIVAVSQGAASDLESYLNCTFSHLVVIYNPVISSVLYEKAKEPLDHPWFVDKHDLPVILAVGRLTEAKNYPLLIEAFAEVVKKTPARLMILGEGEERSHLEKIILDLEIVDVVSLAGFDSNPFRYMSRCDVYVMSSKWEGLPGSLIQALALGANVVSTDCPSGPREILQDGKYGFLVKESREDLSDAILAALQLDKALYFNLTMIDFKIESAKKKYLSLINMKNS